MEGGISSLTTPEYQQKPVLHDYVVGYKDYDSVERQS